MLNVPSVPRAAAVPTIRISPLPAAETVGVGCVVAAAFAWAFSTFSGYVALPLYSAIAIAQAALPEVAVTVDDSPAPATLKNMRLARDDPPEPVVIGVSSAQPAELIVIAVAVALCTDATSRLPAVGPLSNVAAGAVELPVADLL